MWGGINVFSMGGEDEEFSSTFVRRQRWSQNAGAPTLLCPPLCLLDSPPRLRLVSSTPSRIRGTENRGFPFTPRGAPPLQRNLRLIESWFFPWRLVLLSSFCQTLCHEIDPPRQIDLYLSLVILDSLVRPIQLDQLIHSSFLIMKTIHRFLGLTFLLISLAACTPSINDGNFTSSLPAADVQVSEPEANTVVTSPLTVKGEARGTWYFEASFPVKLLDSAGNELAAAPAQAQGEWMTTDFVPFEALLSFATTAETGSLVLMKDNPSGDPANDMSVVIPVRFVP